MITTIFTTIMCLIAVFLGFVLWAELDQSTSEEVVSPEQQLATLEHEELSPEFIAWAQDSDILNHPEDCPGCSKSRAFVGRRNIFTVNESRAEGYFKSVTRAAEIEIARVSLLAEQCHNCEDYACEYYGCDEEFYQMQHNKEQAQEYRNVLVAFKSYGEE